MTTDPLWLPGVVEQYYRAVRVIDRLMPRRLRRVYEAEDFVQMAICDMLTCPHRYDPEEGNPGNIVVLIARRRMIDVVRRRLDSTPRVSLTKELIEIESIRKSWGCGAVKTPDEEAELRDSVDHVVFKLCDHQERVFLTLRSHGYLFEEAASMVGMNERTVMRRLERLRSRMRIHVG